MKISKLFHSLYALLMLAPIFAVGGAMAFNIINDKAVDNAQNEDITYQQAVYQYETNEVNSFSDLVVGNIYSFDIPSIDFSTFRLNYTYSLFDSNYLVISQSISQNNVINDFIDSVSDSVTFYTTFYLFSYDNIGFRIYYNGTSTTYRIYSVLNISEPVYFVYLGGSGISNFIGRVSSCPQEHIPYTLEEVNITYPDNLSDNFYFAMDRMNNSEVFSWAKTSFLAEPFSYIFGLFGIPSGSPFITLLSYWLSISIIWLVFDLVMYVPLLVHGWIDKGGIE